MLAHKVACPSAWRHQARPQPWACKLTAPRPSVHLWAAASESQPPAGRLKRFMRLNTDARAPAAVRDVSKLSYTYWANTGGREGRERGKEGWLETAEAG